ncbi:MAG: alpha-glucuronidase [Dysgonamonadaceae bacterium]|jgi:alpha-glucuronidase|nr:alpha-glucuronidase [Dysgonamonadaceae bacterium]
MKNKLLTIIFLLFLTPLFAEDGSRLWLRYEPKDTSDFLICSKENTSTCSIAEFEIKQYWKGKPVQFKRVSANIRGIPYRKGAFNIVGNKQEIKIIASADIGLLYGAYHLLRLQETGQVSDDLNMTEIPEYDIRILNHWDNIDGSIERGYAGLSLWKWDELPGKVSPRYAEYARANASIGINGTVLNNVNANPLFLSREYLVKAAKLADIFRPWGIRVYLSVNFSSPATLSGLATSDPLDASVRRWWKDKAKEIYSLIPDFGGFLVKANSEGLPGPQDFGRTHADGANMLAEALEPYNGIVMWRAFVYNPSSPDRARQAYEEFKPLDGQFRKNVIIQVKNGPVDFQPREPFTPLFGAMQRTPLMVEFQITQEYLGFSRQLAYLAPLYKECLDADTYAKGRGSTVARVTGGTLFPQSFTAIAGVANTGDDANWTGHPFAQANWYCFGRLAWNPELTSAQIADEWLKMTFTREPAFVDPVREMMLESREAVVNYMTPLGLAHLFAWQHHYGPEPWLAIPGARPDWMPSYYHKADSIGLGFDRTTAGSDAVSQYFPPLCSVYNDIRTCPENLILWFHHVPWNYRMRSGRTLWDELCRKYQEGVDTVRRFQKLWDMMEPYIDAQRFAEVQYKLKIQTRDAIGWKDACLLYFQIFSKQPIPYELERPVHDLQDYKNNLYK